jgi:hypothetical protein
MQYCVYWFCGYYGLRFVLGGIETKLYMQEPLTAKAVIVGWVCRESPSTFFIFYVYFGTRILSDLFPCSFPFLSLFLNVYAEVLLYPLESLVKMLKIKTIICNNDWVIRTYIEEKSTSVKEKKRRWWRQFQQVLLLLEVTIINKNRNNLIQTIHCQQQIFVLVHLSIQGSDNNK